MQGDAVADAEDAQGVGRIGFCQRLGDIHLGFSGSARTMEKAPARRPRSKGFFIIFIRGPRRLSSSMRVFRVSALTWPSSQSTWALSPGSIEGDDVVGDGGDAGRNEHKIASS